MARYLEVEKREAVVAVKVAGRWVQCLEIDPIEIPVEPSAYGPVADVFHPGLIAFLDRMAWAYGDDFKLVWSDAKGCVRGLCPRCDTSIYVDEGVFLDAEGAIGCKSCDR